MNTSKMRWKEKKFVVLNNEDIVCILNSKGDGSVQTTIRKQDGQYMVSISEELLGSVSFEENDLIHIFVDQGRLILQQFIAPPVASSASKTKQGRSTKSLDKRLEEHYGLPIDVILEKDDLYTPEVIDWGAPQGIEVW